MQPRDSNPYIRCVNIKSDTVDSFDFLASLSLFDTVLLSAVVPLTAWRILAQDGQH